MKKILRPVGFTQHHLCNFKKWNCLFNFCCFGKLSGAGFTLVELLIAIAIIGILAGGIFIGINPLEQISKAKDANKRIAVSQLVTALELYAAQNGDKYPQAVGGSSGWITTLVNNGELKDVPSAIPAGTFPCSIEQNGYCYKTNASQTEAIVYAPLETSAHPSGTTPYFLWSSAGGESGTYYSVFEDITSTSGFIFGPSSSLTQGLVGWWKMNGNASDSSGNSNHGTVSGTTLSANRNGQANKAYGFNGTSDYISANISPNIPGTSPITYEAWVYPTAFNVFVVGKTYGDPMGVGIDNTGHIRVRFYTDSSLNLSTYYISTASMSLNAWHQIAVTWAPNIISFYIDGVFSDSQTTAAQTGSISTVSGIVIGYISAGFGYFSGSIDDVRIYNRALSSDEITNLYNAGPQ